MRRLRYSVAVSLDGYIARPDGAYDWIIMDPSIDFAAMFRQFDAAVMGRKTYEIVKAQGEAGALPGMTVIVFSRSLRAEDHPDARIVSTDPARTVAEMKTQPGKDIWLFGGGELFRVLADAGLVDTVELAIMPVLIGRGIPLVPAGRDLKLKLTDQSALPSGIVMANYRLV